METAFGDKFQEKRQSLLGRFLSRGVVVGAPSRLFPRHDFTRRQDQKSGNCEYGNRRTEHGRGLESSSSSGVRFAVTILQSLRGYVRVDLRRRQVLMAEQFLHAADVRAGVEQVCRKRMSKRVRRGPRIEAGLAKIFQEQPP